MAESLEREIKLRFAAPDEARAAVLAAGARLFRPRRLQDDALFDTDDEALRRQRSVLRVRREGERSALTFKGPVRPGPMKLREELETGVADGAVLSLVLERLGLRVWFRYQKYREEYAAEGVVIAQGGRFGGWAVHVKDGHLKFTYNVLGIHEFAVTAEQPIPASAHQVRMEFAYDGGGLAKGGKVTLYTDGDAVGEGRVEMTQPMVFSADETTDIGRETGTTVSSDYTAATSRFNGKIEWVQIDLGDDDHDHFISDEERLRIALSKQ